MPRIWFKDKSRENEYPSQGFIDVDDSFVDTNGKLNKDISANSAYVEIADVDVPYIISTTAGEVGGILWHEARTFIGQGDHKYNPCNDDGSADPDAGFL